MDVNYRGIALLWLGLWLGLAAPSVFAARVEIGKLELEVDEAWQRASKEDEADAVSLILHDSGGLEVFVPRRLTPLKTSQDDFYAQIDVLWQSRYSQLAMRDWLDAGGTRWRYCRHVGADGKSVVFQLVTVHDGQAYQAVVVAAPKTEALPDRVVQLLAQSQWQDAQPALPGQLVAGFVAPEAGAAKPVADAAADVSASGSGTSAPAAKPDDRTLPPGHWRQLRKVAALGRSGQWESIVAATLPRLGMNNRLSGLGVNAGESDLDWFLDGEGGVQDEQGRYTLNRYHASWRVKWSPPPEVLTEGEAFAPDPVFSSADMSSQGQQDFGIRYGFTAVCAPRAEIVSWLNALEKGKENYQDRLARLESGCTGRGADPASMLLMASEKAAGEGGRLTLPPEWTQGMRPARGDAVKRIVLVARFAASWRGDAPGDPMLDRIAFLYVYGPD